MNSYTWGVDGFGRQHIINLKKPSEIVMSTLGHNAKACIELLIEQDGKNEETNKK